MRNWKSLPALTGAIVVLAIVLYVAFYFVFIDFFVDLWWFESLNFEGYFWLKMLYRFIFSGVVTAFFFAIFQFHFWIASRYLGLNPQDDVFFDDTKRRSFQRLADVFMTGSTKVFTPVSLLLAIAIATPFYLQWEQALLFFFGSASGVVDPVYGNDVSFYMLQYPFYQLITKGPPDHRGSDFGRYRGSILDGTYFCPESKQGISVGSQNPHGCIVWISRCCLSSGDIFWKDSRCFFAEENEPVFFGPGFIEMRYQLPVDLAVHRLCFGCCRGRDILCFFGKTPQQNANFYRFIVFICSLRVTTCPYAPGLNRKNYR